MGPSVAPIFLAISLLLGACGGGGDQGLPITTPPRQNEQPNADAQSRLSEQQRRFESFALDSNGGYFDFFWSLPLSGVADSESYFVSQQFTIRQSPLTAGPQAVNAAPTSNMTRTLGMPAGEDDSRSWMLRDGIFHTLAELRHVIRYQGEDVIRDAFVPTLTGPVLSHRLHVDMAAQLSGTVGDTPEELSNMVYALFENSALMNRQTPYLQGAAFMKVTITRLGDFFWVWDCVDADKKPPAGPLACATGTTLEAYLKQGFTFADNSRVTWADGVVNSVDGYSMWVANTPFTARDNPVKVYTTFIEKDGVIYRGSLARDGALVNGLEKGRLGSDQVEYIPYWTFANDAARRSLKAALLF